MIESDAETVRRGAASRSNSGENPMSFASFIFWTVITGINSVLLATVATFAFVAGLILRNDFWRYHPRYREGCKECAADREAMGAHNRKRQQRGLESLRQAAVNELHRPPPVPDAYKGPDY